MTAGLCLGIVGAMLVLRCTKKLLTRMRTKPMGSPPQAQTLLGDWYATLVHLGRMQVVLCVSERTLLPLLMPAVGVKDLHQHLPQALAVVLRRLGAKPTDIKAEMARMSPHTITATANRQVLGVMKEFVLATGWRFDEDGGLDLLETSLWLADTPCLSSRPGDCVWPIKATLEILGAH